MAIETIEQIYAECDSLANLMVEKGVVGPKAQVALKSGSSCHVYLGCSYRQKVLDGSDMKFIHADTVGEAIEKARSYISALPSLSETTQREYLKRVSSAIDYATENAIDEKMVSPLRGVSKAMTDNLLAAE